MRPLGDDLLDLCRGATAELVLAAPFVKVGVVGRILEVVASEVILTCVTRWRPEEVAAGVSDLEVFDLLSDRAYSRMLLRHDLHAKYYRADQRSLIGSANLTAAALGWREPSNFELLVPWDVDQTVLAATEDKLLAGTVLASSSLKAVVGAAAAQIKQDSPPALAALSDDVSTTPSTALERLEQWIPRLRHPELLFAVYRGDHSTITGQGLADGVADLSILSPAPGLYRESFEKSIGATILQAPTLNAIDDLVSEPKRFGEVRAFLRDRLGESDDDVDPAEAWQTIIRWLLYFLPDRYGLAVPGDYSEVFRRL